MNKTPPPGSGFIDRFVTKTSLYPDQIVIEEPENFNLHPGFSLSSSASYLDPHTIKELTDAVGVEINQAYGSTETLAVSSAYKKKERAHSASLLIIPQFGWSIFEAAMFPRGKSEKLSHGALPQPKDI